MKLRSVLAHLPPPACKHMKHTHIYIKIDRKKVGIFQRFLCNGFCASSKHLDLLFAIEYYETPPWVKISPGYWGIASAAISDLICVLKVMRKLL